MFRRIVTGLLMIGGILTGFFIQMAWSGVSRIKIQIQDETIACQRLHRLSDELKIDRQKALCNFWKETEGNTPIVEYIDKKKSYLVTFIWRGNKETKNVAVAGGRPGSDWMKPLVRLFDTDLWYRSEAYPEDARFNYYFQVNGPIELPDELNEMRKVSEKYPWEKDPLNSRNFKDVSYVEMPNAPLQPWIANRPEVPKGMTTIKKYSSKVLSTEYSLNIYTPPGYELNNDYCWLLISFDGGFPLAENTLNNLLEAKKIPPLISIGIENIDSQSRTRDLGCSDLFLSFLVNEVVPWIKSTYRVYSDPMRTIIGGISRGGLMASFCALKYPEIFGKVLSQSGAFENPPGAFPPFRYWMDDSGGWIIRQYSYSPKKQIEFYIEIGRYDTSLWTDRLGLNRRFRDVLEAKSYPVIYSEFNGGHDYVCWRGSFADGIISLTKDK